MEAKKIYPCVKCAGSTFKKKIAPKLRRWGYKFDTGKGCIVDFSSCPILQTGYAIDMDSDAANVVGNFYSIDEDAGQYLCASIPEFLEKAKELAIENGWFKEEGDFPKASTIPSAPPKRSEGIPTLEEARKMFRELTKHYPVETLSKRDLPKSWEELLEQEGGEPVDERIEALHRLLLLREAWVDGDTSAEANISCNVSGEPITCKTDSRKRGTLFTFPTYQMAMQFRDTFCDDLKKVFKICN